MTRKLMLLALIALVVCTGFGFKASCTAPPEEWRLTIQSTEGGEVIRPARDVAYYDAGEVVVLEARPYRGYRFVKWTGKVDTIGNRFMATTTITMELDYTITANFAPVAAGEHIG